MVKPVHQLNDYKRESAAVRAVIEAAVANRKIVPIARELTMPYSTAVHWVIRWRAAGKPSYDNFVRDCRSQRRSIIGDAGEAAVLNVICRDYHKKNKAVTDADVLREIQREQQKQQSQCTTRSQRKLVAMGSVVTRFKRIKHLSKHSCSTTGNG